MGWGAMPRSLGWCSLIVSEHQRIERGIAPQPMPVQQLHDGREISNREIGGTSPGIEASFETEIDRISPIGNRRPQAVMITRRGQQFGSGLHKTNIRDAFSEPREQQKLWPVLCWARHQKNREQTKVKRPQHVDENKRIFPCLFYNR